MLFKYNSIIHWDTQHHAMCMLSVYVCVYVCKNENEWMRLCVCVCVFALTTTKHSVFFLCADFVLSEDSAK